MARTASTIQTEIDALRANMARGVLRVKHGETETTYQTIEGMERALNLLLAELNAVGDTPTRQVRFKTSKGLDL